MLVAPHQLPYDSPEESGKRMRFDVELARIADLNLCNFGKNRTSLRAFSTGDTVEVIVGLFCGERGYVVALHEHTIVLVIMQPDKTSETIMHFHQPSHFQGMKPYWVMSYEHIMAHSLARGESLSGLVLTDRGYNVAVGDTMEVARGQWHHSEGIVKTVDLTKASLDIVCPVDRIQINVPIMFVCKIKEHFDHGLSKFACPSDSCLRMGMLLDGTLLPLKLQCSIKSLHSQSFITPVVLHNMTPPPSPGPLDVGSSDARSVIPTDITKMQTIDYGEVPWLFKSDFYDFKSFHFGFNVSVGFTQVSLVTGHNAGLAMQHLTIPAWYLMPVNPTSKNQLCLILKGPQAGRVVSIKKCQWNSKLVMTDDGTTLQFSDICVAFEYNHA
ncbi:hypothetical protein EDC04DRAFT_2609518 [Pisolithus marmoratus]|nr:hypothetical protein EDC04DRAFT_2609518 [Pisolithus marmoratus]